MCACYVCGPVSHDADRTLDRGIVRALWMTPDEIDRDRARHRSPLVARTVADYLSGRRYPLDLMWTDPGALHAPQAGAVP